MREMLGACATMRRPAPRSRKQASMDPAVGLVQAYLHANGYLTATEYPIVEALEGGGYRTVTDIDILAVRLPGAGRIVPHRGGVEVACEERLFEPDPALIDERADLWVDFIIGEVKEGRAELNRGAREVSTLVTALRPRCSII